MNASLTIYDTYSYILQIKVNNNSKVIISLHSNSFLGWSVDASEVSGIRKDIFGDNRFPEMPHEVINLDHKIYELPRRLNRRVVWLK